MAYAYPFAGTPAYYDYSTSASNSPAPEDGAYIYAVPQYQTPTSKRHNRTASCQQPPRMFASPAHYPSPAFYANHYDYASLPHQSDYVSAKESSTRRSRRSVDDAYVSLKSSMRSPPKQRIYDASDNASDPSDDERPHVFEIRPSAGRPSPASRRRPLHPTDRDVPQTYDTSIETPSRSRARRATASHGSGHKKSASGGGGSRTPKPAKQAPVMREATAADAARFSIPAGFSLKNWDPTEQPILLLGSAFDGNSLGKWIYDWTVYHHAAGAPMTDVAGDLWLLLIKFTGKMKRADECRPRVRNPSNQDMLDDFLESGDKIWGRLKNLLHICEDHMWKGARKEAGKVSMGEKSGVEFVKTIFGRERELERTERLMNSIRLWNMRFDADCEDILRRPSAK